MNQILYEAAFDAVGVDEIESKLWEFASVDKWPVDIGALVEAVVELADNAVLHSGEGGGWCSMQQGHRPHDHLTVVIADRGVGIPHRVNQVTDPPKLDDYDAMLLAFEPRFSSTQDAYRGFGLNLASDFTERASRAVFSLESGHAVYAAESGRGRVLSRGSRPVKGVIARISVPVATRQAQTCGHLP